MTVIDQNYSDTNIKVEIATPNATEASIPTKKENKIMAGTTNHSYLSFVNLYDCRNHAFIRSKKLKTNKLENAIFGMYKTGLKFVR